MDKGIKCGRFECPNDAIVALGIDWVGGCEYVTPLCNDHFIDKISSLLTQQQNIQRMESTQ